MLFCFSFCLLFLMEAHLLYIGFISSSVYPLFSLRFSRFSSVIPDKRGIIKLIFIAWWLLNLLPGWKFKNLTFCPQSLFMYLLWFPPPLQKIDVIFVYKIYRIVFKPRGSVFTARYEWNPQFSLISVFEVSEMLDQLLMILNSLMPNSDDPNSRLQDYGDSIDLFQ